MLAGVRVVPARFVLADKSDWWRRTCVTLCRNCSTCLKWPASSYNSKQRDSRNYAINSHIRIRFCGRPKYATGKPKKDCVCVYFNVIINVWMPFSSNNTEILQTHTHHDTTTTTKKNLAMIANEFRRTEWNWYFETYTRLSSRKMKSTNCSVVARL